MKYLIDSNIWIYALGNISEIIELFTNIYNDNNGGYSFITEIEILGYKKIESNELSKLKKMLDLSNKYDMTNDILKRTIKLRQNYSIKTPDAIIAATALTNDLILVTRNTKDFNKIKELKLFNPLIITQREI